MDWIWGGGDGDQAGGRRTGLGRVFDGKCDGGEEIGRQISVITFLI